MPAITWLAAGWLLGVAASQSAALESQEWLILGAAALVLVVVLRAHRPQRLLFASVMMFALGAARGLGARTVISPDHVAFYNDLKAKVTLTGVVSGFPDVRDRYVGLRVEAEAISVGSDAEAEPVSGQVLVWASRYRRWTYGDRVRAYGRLETPPEFESFSYKAYLARQDVHSLMASPWIERNGQGEGNWFLAKVYTLRARAYDLVMTILPDPEASLLAGILLGLERSIPPDVLQDFNATGTSHIIAISGFNITIIAGLFTRFFGRAFGAKAGAWTAALAIAAYTILVGAEAAVVRAAVMGGLALLARQLGRESHGLSALAVAAMAMTVADPDVLWDVGFQLSFAATLGLVVYADPLIRWFVRAASNFMEETRAKSLAGPVGEFVLYTLAAQITTLPLVAYYFQRFSLVSWIANPVILPLQPALMVLGGLAVLGGMIWLPLGQVLAWVAWPLPALTVRLVAFFAQWPLASLPLGRISWLAVAAYYVLLFGGTRFLRSLAARVPVLQGARIPQALIVVFLALGSGLAWRAYADRPDGRLHVVVLDVGAGDAVLIESPTGRFVLIDGGSSPIALSDALGRRLPVFRRHIDWLVVGATQREQVAGLAGVAERFSISQVIVAGPPGGRAFMHLMESLTDHGRPIHEARGKPVLDLGGGASLQILAVGEQGAALKISQGWLQILLVPGADPRLIEVLAGMPATRDVQVLLLADGGAAAVNPPGWLVHTHPWLAIASVQAGNAEGLPADEVLAGLEGATVLRTDVNGWIELTSGGRWLWVQVQHGAADAGGN